MGRCTASRCGRRPDEWGSVLVEDAGLLSSKAHHSSAVSSTSCEEVRARTYTRARMKHVSDDSNPTRMTPVLRSDLSNSSSDGTPEKLYVGKFDIVGHIGMYSSSKIVQNE